MLWNHILRKAYYWDFGVQCKQVHYRTVWGITFVCIIKVASWLSKADLPYLRRETKGKKAFIKKEQTSNTLFDVNGSHLQISGDVFIMCTTRELFAVLLPHQHVDRRRAKCCYLMWEALEATSWLQSLTAVRQSFQNTNSVMASAVSHKSSVQMFFCKSYWHWLITFQL